MPRSLEIARPIIVRFILPTEQPSAPSPPLFASLLPNRSPSPTPSTTSTSSTDDTAAAMEQSKRDTRRYSSYTTISSAPSITPSTVTSTFSEIDEGLRRLDDRRLQTQRFVASDQKTEVLQKLALGAKLERALGRRLAGQDAVPRSRSKTEGQIVAPSAPVVQPVAAEAMEPMDEKAEMSETEA